MGITFVNETGDPPFNSVMSELTATFSDVDWDSRCGVPVAKYTDGREGASGPLSEVRLKFGYDGLAHNSQRDSIPLGDGTYADNIFIDPTKTSDLSPDQWASLILHELLHGTESINRAADLLAARFLQDFPNLSGKQKSIIRSIVEEVIIRDKVNRMEWKNPDGMIEKGGFAAIDPSLSREALLGLIDDYDGRLGPAGSLSSDQKNALARYFENTQDLGDPCGLPERLPLMTPEQITRAMLGLFERAEQIRSPLILDLDGDGIETLGHDFFIHFDHDRNRFAERTGWVAPDDGLLVLDRNGNGTIDDGSELFGNYSGGNGATSGSDMPGDNPTLVQTVMPRNGFEALAAFDSNRDGKIDAADPVFANLRVWKDANSFGLSDEGGILFSDGSGAVC